MPVRRGSVEESDILIKMKHDTLFLKGCTDADIEEIKPIVCTFYKGGGCPDCKGCMQPAATVMECKDDYLSKIESKPMEKWTTEFDSLKVRKKVKLKELHHMGLNCNKRYLSDSCPLYEAGSMCGIDWEEDEKLSPKQVVDKLIDIQFKRVNRTSKIEEVDGGVADQNLSTEMDRLSGLVELRNNMNMDKFQISVAGQMQSNSQQSPGGLLQQLFAKPGAETAKELPEKPLQTVDIQHEEIKERIK